MTLHRKSFTTVVNIAAELKLLLKIGGRMLFRALKRTLSITVLSLNFRI